MTKERLLDERLKTIIPRTPTDPRTPKTLKTIIPRTPTVPCPPKILKTIIPRSSPEAVSVRQSRQIGKAGFAGKQSLLLILGTGLFVRTYEATLRRLKRFELAAKSLTLP